ncbi:Endonuclease/Exonuclease/phosphatase family protein [Rubripirellula tenax]|uniref:Endonuclease/Exonuclease/phosphatase family protein n=1 Tax=Rubripirellula tenax TaxID=2528015 RepID=A0A5C6FFZ7_9BACT|nr:endonuclease/exonuclease/phosphatase family protein [Rubripirellula tenax]TWU59730.1 Endonuclease/Exonuclease/phosphatase family protein [Rubripirellula tenax]
MRIVFWNVKRKDLTNLVCDMAAENEAAIVVLNECKLPIGDTLGALKANVDNRFFIPESNSEDRFQCFCKYPTLDLSEVHKGFRTSVRRLKLGNRIALLGLVHGVDIRNYDAETRQAYAQSLADEIRFVKTEQATNHLILLGDFNMNPHDRGMNLAMGLNAMMTKECVKAGDRTFLGKQYEFYYNPMWSLQGDGSDGPAGTVYDTSSQGPYGWNMLDQVIVNHSIVDDFRGIEILTQAGPNRLTDARGRPDATSASDHLPIVVTLKGVTP